MRRTSFADSIRVGEESISVPQMSEVLRPSQKSVQAIGSRVHVLRAWLGQARARIGGLTQKLGATTRGGVARLRTRFRRTPRTLEEDREPNIDALFAPTAESSIKTRLVETPAAVTPPLTVVFRRDHMPRQKKKLSPLQRAQEALHEKDYQHAEDILVDHIVHHTKDTQAYMLLGRIATAKANWHEAMEIYEQVVSLRPTEPGAQAGLGIAAYNSGRYGKALQALQRAHEADPTNLEVLQDLLGIAQKMDNPALQHSIQSKLEAAEAATPVAEKALPR